MHDASESSGAKTTALTMFGLLLVACGASALAARIAARVTRPWVLMEICGGQTHTIMRYGIDEILPRQVELVHGPGCPVCVTPDGYIDAAMQEFRDADVVFGSHSWPVWGNARAMAACR